MSDNVTKLEERNQRRMKRLAEQFERGREAQAKELVFDVDAAWRESDARLPPLVFRFQGVEYDVPRSPPLAYVVFHLRHCVTPNPGQPGTFVLDTPKSDDQLFPFLELLLGVDFADAVKGSAMPFHVLMRSVIRPIWLAWGLIADDTQETEKKTETEADQTPASSSGDGPLSKPTSSPSTESTSDARAG